MLSHTHASRLCVKSVLWKLNKGLFSKETVVLRLWGSETQQF